MGGADLMFLVVDALITRAGAVLMDLEVDAPMTYARAVSNALVVFS